MELFKKNPENFEEKPYWRKFPRGTHPTKKSREMVVNRIPAYVGNPDIEQQEYRRRIALQGGPDWKSGKPYDYFLYDLED